VGSTGWRGDRLHTDQPDPITFILGKGMKRKRNENGKGMKVIPGKGMKMEKE
jgi:hypothetical protein